MCSNAAPLVLALSACGGWDDRDLALAGFGPEGLDQSGGGKNEGAAALRTLEGLDDRQPAAATGIPPRLGLDFPRAPMQERRAYVQARSLAP